KKVFQEFLTHQGTVVKPCCWQGQNPVCAKCPYHVRTGEEARVPYTEFHKLFAFPCGSPETPQNRHLLFYELRSSLGRVLQKGHATSCSAQGTHPEDALFEVGAYLDAAASTCASISSITLYSNFSPCNEAQHRCARKMFSFLLRHPHISLWIYFCQRYPWGDSASGALRGLCSLWPRVTLQRLPGGAWPYLLGHFVGGITRATPRHPALPAGPQNPRQINLTGMQTYFGTAFPEGMQGNPAGQQSLKAFSSLSPASQQPFPAMKGSLLPLVSPSHRVPFPGVFLPSQREQLYPRPRNIIRHLKMPKD
ncbi:ABEC4 enzyme, partial [Pardalotus punctatus]|nr:ABEC4 enzyme [Pardalotus punctatus]